MKEEIEKIFKPKKSSIVMLFAYLVIATICIGVGLYWKYELTKDPLNFSQEVINKSEEEGKYASVDVAYLPELLATTPEKENCLYFIKDKDNHIYIARLSNKTLNNLKSMCNEETKELSTVCNLKGYIKTIDVYTKDLALSASKKALPDENLTSDNFSEKLGTIYLTENMDSENSNQARIYPILGMVGVFFIILAIYIIPVIIRDIKFLKDKDLIDELKNELESLTDNPYKDINVYLTNKYIFSTHRGKQAIKYEDIILANIYIQYTSLVETGRRLIVYTEGNKRHFIASVGPGNNILENVLADIQNKNPNIKIGDSKEK